MKCRGQCLPPEIKYQNKMATIYLEFKGHRARHTPKATVSSTFLQRVSELDTPLKGHSLSPRRE